jgi:hypothetical protein
MKKHNSYNPESYYTVGMLLALFTLGVSFYFFYEYFFEHYYWYNRKYLYKKLDSGEWYVVSKREVTINNDIVEYKLNNGYVIWVYQSINKIVLTEGDYDNYIGLFTCSPIMKLYNKRIIKMLSSGNS